MASKEKLIEKAQKQIQKGNLEKAIVEYQNASNLDQKDVSIRLRIGDLYVKTGKVAEAIKEYSDVARLNSQQGFYLKAIAVYKQVLKLDVSNLDVHYRLAELYTKQRLIADAIGEYGVIVATFDKKGKSNEAFELLRKMVDIDAENIGVRLKLAENLQMQKFDADAVAEYATVLEMLLAKDRLDRAETIYVDLYNTYPGNVSVLEGLSEIFKRKGEDRQYLRFAKALKNAHVESGDNMRAREVSEAILEKSPEDTDALVFLGLDSAPEVEEASSSEEDFSVAESVADESVSAEVGFGEVEIGESEETITEPEEEVVEESPKELEEESAEEIEIDVDDFDLEEEGPESVELMGSSGEAEETEPEAEIEPEIDAEVEFEIPPEETEPEVELETAADEVEAPEAESEPEIEPEVLEPEPVVEDAPEPVIEDAAPEIDEPVESEVELETAADEVETPEAEVEPELESEAEVLEAEPEPVADEAPSEEEAAPVAPEIDEPVEPEVELETAADEVEAPEAESKPESEPEVLEPELEPEITPESVAEEVEPEVEPEITPESVAEEVEPEITPEPVAEEVELEPVEEEAAPEPVIEDAAPEIDEPVEPEVEPEITPESVAEEVEPEPVEEEAAPVAPEIDDPVEPEFELEIAADEVEAPEAEVEPTELEAVSEVEDIEEVETEEVEEPLESDDLAEQAISEAIDELMDKIEPEPSTDDELGTSLEKVADDTVEEMEDEYVDLSAELGMGEVGAISAPLPASTRANETVDELRTGLEDQLRREDTETHYNLGIAYMEMELYKEASKEFKVALKDPSLELDCYSRLGMSAMAESNADEAITYFKKALKIEEGWSEDERKGCMYELALAYEGAQNRPEAAALFTEISEIDSGYREVAEKVAEYGVVKPQSIPMDDSLLEVELL